MIEANIMPFPTFDQDIINLKELSELAKIELLIPAIPQVIKIPINPPKTLSTTASVKKF